MSTFKKIKLLDSKFSWSFFSFFFGLLFGIVGIYTTFFYEEDTSITFQILNNTNVLDINEEVNTLDILLNGKSIQSSKQNLRIVTIKVLNDGSTDILKNHFDLALPLSLEIIDGQIVETPSIIDASNKYLKTTVKLHQKSNQLLVFNDFIIEKGEYFLIKLLLLHNTSVNPKFISIGKIAGIKTIPIENDFDEQKEQGFLDLAFDGNVWIHIFRVIVYPISFLLIIVCTFVPIILVINLKEKISRKRVVKKYKMINDLKNDLDNNFFFDIYINRGKPELLAMEKILNEPDLLIPQLKDKLNKPNYKIDQQLRGQRDFMPQENIDMELNLYSDHFFIEIFQQLTEEEFIILNEESWKISEKKVGAFQSFIKYLRVLGIIKKDDKAILKSEIIS